jgi:hypothetical protein
MSISKCNFHQLQRLKRTLAIGNGGVYRPALKPVQFKLCRHEGEGGYEKSSKESFVVYLTERKLL